MGENSWTFRIATYWHKNFFRKSINVILHKFKSSHFKFLRSVVSIAAVIKIVEELKKSNTIGVDDIACKCILRKTHGLSCAHELAEYGIVNMLIPLDSIDSHWRKTKHVTICACWMRSDNWREKSLTEKVDKINQYFIKINDFEKIILLKRMRELVNPSTYSLIKPEVKIRKRGKNGAKNETSTHRLSMVHELITSAQDSCSKLPSQSKIQVSFESILRPKEKV